MILRVDHLSFSRNGGVSVLKDLSFEINKGDVLCLLGPNGTGKTTLIRCVLGIYRPTTGDVYIDGTNTKQIKAKELAKKIAYVPQSTNAVFDYTVMNIIIMGRNPHIGYFSSPSRDDEKIAEEALELLEMTHLKDRHYNELSGGERQMVLIARALTQQSDILIMDEPTASLDYGNESRILRMVRKIAETGISIIMTTHSPDHAFLTGSKVAIMNNGRIQAFGSPHEIVTSHSLSDLYATPIHVISSGVKTRLDNRKDVKVCVPLL